MEFKCDPKELCNGAYCCRNDSTVPDLSPGDFLRIADRFGRPVEDIWRNYGDISLVPFPNLPAFNFKIGLGLLHDPCPFLNLECRCGIYEVRPATCANFPFTVFTDPSALKVARGQYRCLKDVEISPDQERLRVEFCGIFRDMAALDLQYFWTGGAKYADISKPDEHEDMAQKALRVQLRRDGDEDSYKARRIRQSVIDFKKFYSGLRSQKGRAVMVNGTRYARCWAPIVLSLTEDAITAHFQHLTPQALMEYRALNARCEGLLR